MSTPSKLYIIGNGFDLWHQIPSHYSNFKTFLEKNDRKVFNEIEDYIPIDDLWNELEEALAQIDVDFLVENHEHFLVSYGSDDWSDSAHHDFQFEIQEVVNRLSNGLSARFSEWVRSIDARNASTDRLKKIDTNSTFLTFNYTDTLFALYSIPHRNILHIHGQASNPTDHLILGHAWNPSTRKSLNDITDVEDLDTRLQQANEIIDSYFTDTFKPSSEIIKRNDAFFQNLGVIHEVVVLGHSLSEVDAPYFRTLLEQTSCSAANWRVACLDGEDRDKISRLADFGVPTTRIITEPWSHF